MNPLAWFRKRRQVDPANGLKDRIQPGDIITLFADFGPVREATNYVIEVSGQLQADVDDALMKAFRSAVGACQPGITVAQVLSAAHAPLRQSRFVRTLSSRLVWALAQTGEHIEFYPPEGDTVLAEGMTLSIEPTVQVVGLRANLLSMTDRKWTQDVIKVGRVVQVKEGGGELQALGHDWPPESLEVLSQLPDAMF